MKWRNRSRTLPSVAHLRQQLWVESQDLERKRSRVVSDIMDERGVFDSEAVQHRMDYSNRCASAILLRHAIKLQKPPSTGADKPKSALSDRAAYVLLDEAETRHTDLQILLKRRLRPDAEVPSRKVPLEPQYGAPEKNVNPVLHGVMQELVVRQMVEIDEIMDEKTAEHQMPGVLKLIMKATDPIITMQVEREQSVSRDVLLFDGMIGEREFHLPQLMDAAR